MKQQRYIPQATDSLRLADAQAVRTCGNRSGLRLRSRLESVLALYPSTTTEIPFT